MNCQIDSYKLLVSIVNLNITDENVVINYVGSSGLIIGHLSKGMGCSGSRARPHNKDPAPASASASLLQAREDVVLMTMTCKKRQEEYFSLPVYYVLPSLHNTYHLTFLDTFFFSAPIYMYKIYTYRYTIN
jgi:hypothetical protein